MVSTNSMEEKGAKVWKSRESLLSHTFEFANPFHLVEFRYECPDICHLPTTSCHQQRITHPWARLYDPLTRLGFSQLVEAHKDAS